MRQLRSIGTFLIVGAIICGVMSYEFYATKKATALEVAKQMGLELVSFDIPIPTKVAGFFAVMLLVAGLACLWNLNSKSHDGQPQSGQSAGGQSEPTKML